MIVVPVVTRSYGRFFADYFLVVTNSRLHNYHQYNTTHIRKG